MSHSKGPAIKGRLKPLISDEGARQLKEQGLLGTVNAAKLERTHPVARWWPGVTAPMRRKRYMAHQSP